MTEPGDVAHSQQADSGKADGVVPRVLVTGSRTWQSWHTVAMNLSHLLRHIGPFVLVHGACPRGADAMAAEWADIHADSGITVEAHPADWDGLGKRAGYVRNAHMVKLGADWCLAFIYDRSRGATHCADLAEKAGIKTQRFETSSR